MKCFNGFRNNNVKSNEYMLKIRSIRISEFNWCEMLTVDVRLESSAMSKIALKLMCFWKWKRKSEFKWQIYCIDREKRITKCECVSARAYTRVPLHCTCIYKTHFGLASNLHHLLIVNYQIMCVCLFVKWCWIFEFFACFFFAGWNGRHYNICRNVFFFLVL